MYTKGPWEAHWHDKWVIGDSENFHHLAILPLDSKIPAREMDDNSRLIAAAPELLEACKEALQHIKDLCSRLDDYEDTGDYIIIINDLESVIAKAEGKEGRG
jgi:hypothetical protein